MRNTNNMTRGNAMEQKWATITMHYYDILNKDRTIE